MRLPAILLSLLGLCCTASAAKAVTCDDRLFEGQTYAVCTVHPATDRLALYLYDADGAAYGGFSALEAAFPGRRLVFAMNAGMFHPDYAPVGYYVEDGHEVMRLLTNDSPGNFGLLPNGVLCLRPGRADVIETLRFAAQAPACTSATQSGPMLVIDGALHPDFLAGGTSRLIRNGVGTSADGGTAWFVISNGPVNFHTFARFFRDVLGAPQALFFDGNVSRLHAPQIGRSDGGWPVGPLVGVFE